MNRYANEDVAWLHVQDMQREAENRRLAAGGRQPSMLAAVRRVFRRSDVAAGAPQAAERRREPA